MRNLTGWAAGLLLATGVAGCATSPPTPMVDPPPTLGQQIIACGAIDDMTKDRLDCFDAITVPTPPGPAVAIVKCRAVVEQDIRLVCFDNLLIVQTAPPPKMPTYTRPSPKRYVRRGRGGCGSRGGSRGGRAIA